MEKEENLNEIFDLKPIIPDIYSFDDETFFIRTQTCDGGSTRANTKQLGNCTSWNSCHPHETICVDPPTLSCSAAATAAASVSVPKLISFEKSKDSDVKYNSNPNEMTSEIINFSSSSNDDSEGNTQYQDSAKGISQKRLCALTRTPSQALDHLLSERKRRENLSQLFISLSKVVPGLKKLDKASLLEDGVNYLKALQEQVRVLEKEEIKKGSMDTWKNEEKSSIDNSGIKSQSSAPEIQARISDKHVLMKIFCKKQMDLMSRIPDELEKIHLDAIDMRIMPFGGAAVDITILAEMQSEFEGTVEDIVDHLHTVFLNPHDNITNVFNNL